MSKKSNDRNGYAPRVYHAACNKHHQFGDLDAGVYPQHIRHPITGTNHFATGPHFNLIRTHRGETRHATYSLDAAIQAAWLDLVTRRASQRAEWRREVLTGSDRYMVYVACGWREGIERVRVLCVDHRYAPASKTHIIAARVHYDRTQPLGPDNVDLFYAHPRYIDSPFTRPAHAILPLDNFKRVSVNSLTALHERGLGGMYAHIFTHGTET